MTHPDTYNQPQGDLGEAVATPRPVRIKQHASEDNHRHEMNQSRPDAADAGKFLRRQIRSPGDYNKGTFLKRKEKRDHKLLQDHANAKKLKPKATPLTSITSALRRNKLLFDEDARHGECSRYQCEKPRNCFLARKAKQETGWSLYDSWKCYKPPPHREQ